MNRKGNIQPINIEPIQERQIRAARVARTALRANQQDQTLTEKSRILVSDTALDLRARLGVAVEPAFAEDC